MSYAKNFRTWFILGCGIILDGIPRLLPMVLNSKGNWIKKISMIDKVDEKKVIRSKIKRFKRG